MSPGNDEAHSDRNERSKAVETIAKQISEMQSTMYSPLINQITQISQNISIPAITVPKICLQQIEIHDVFKEMNQNIHAFIERISEMDEPQYVSFRDEFEWMGPLPLSTALICFDNYKINGIKGAWTELEAFFRLKEVIDEIVTDIQSSPLTSRREKILRIGLGHHLSGDYVSSVSVLLPQVEGLIWELGVGLQLVEKNRIVK
jgi:hypothetical protein